MQQSIAKMKIAAYSPDILLEFPSKIARSYEFYRAEELIKLGYEVAERELGKRQINKGP
jgi:NTE family protein